MEVGLCGCGCGKPTTVAKKNETKWGHVKGQPMKFLLGHNLRGIHAPAEERFWGMFEEDPDTHCWQWNGSLVQSGYGRHGGTSAHRYAYELLVGPIPEGLHIDHLCRNRGCVNPGHMETVTIAENVLRGEGVTARQRRQTHCKRGHPLSGDNLRVTPDGHRVCRACQRDWALAAYHSRKRAA
jgi:hypothetical protein